MTFSRRSIMKAKYAATLAIASFAFGGVVVHGLHAEAKPPAYAIAEIAVSDPEKYRTEFLPPAKKAVEEAGGKYITRGGAAVSFIGAPPGRVVVLQFENMEKAQAWWNSPARKESDAIGEKYATFRVFAVEGVSP
jgi:uncharacterized protein (DUF1330 family)